MDILKIIDDQLTVLSKAKNCECYLSRNAFLSMIEWFNQARDSVFSPPAIEFKKDANYGAEEFFFDRVLADDFITQSVQEIDKPYLRASWTQRKWLEFSPKDPWYIFAAFLFLVDLKRKPPKEELVLCDILAKRLIIKSSDGIFTCQPIFEKMPFKNLLLLKLLCVLEANQHLLRKNVYKNGLFDGEVCKANRSIFHQLYEDLSFLLAKKASEEFIESLSILFKRSGDEILLFRTAFHDLLISTAMQIWDIGNTSPDANTVAKAIKPVMLNYDQLIGKLEHQQQRNQENPQLSKAVETLLNVVKHTRDNLRALKKVFNIL